MGVLVSEAWKFGAACVWDSVVARVCSKSCENVHALWPGNSTPQDCILRKLSN